MNHLACSITLAADKPTGTHEFTNELGAQLVWDPRVAGPPPTSVDSNVVSIRRTGHQ